MGKTVIVVYNGKGVTATISEKGITKMITYMDEKKMIMIDGRRIKDPHPSLMKRMKEIFLSIATID